MNDRKKRNKPENLKKGRKSTVKKKKKENTEEKSSDGSVKDGNDGRKIMDENSDHLKKGLKDTVESKEGAVQATSDRDLDLLCMDKKLVQLFGFFDPQEREMLEAASADLDPDEIEDEIGIISSDITSDKIDPDAVKVIRRLQRFNHEAYLVGGCVRDLLLGYSPKDFDLATSAKPDEIRKAFRNCRLIGRRFRLAHIFFRGGKIIETATFRKKPRDDENGDGGEDNDLYITTDNTYGTAEEDARRRDFTINALFYNLREGRVIDYVGGKRDLELGIIRTVGDPSMRIPEDPVRILRAVRFAAVLGFRIEDETWKEIKLNVADIPKCHVARVTEEILRILRSGAARGGISLLHSAGALEILLPPVAEYLDGAGDEEEARFYSILDAVDEWGHDNGGPPSDAVLLAALMLSLVGPDCVQTDKSEALEFLLTGFLKDSRLPKRVSERIRLVLGAQRIFAGHRKKRFSVKRFLNQTYIPDAMVLFEIRARAFGEQYKEFRRWSDRLSQMIKSGQVASEDQKRHGAPVKRRKRRRRGALSKSRR